MDGTGNRLESDGEHMWLRYATQFTLNGRSHTVEMGLPMPIGASSEEREALLREADAGMRQVVEHVEKQVARMLQRPQSAPSGAHGAIPTPAPTPTSPPKAPASTRPAAANNPPVVLPAVTPAPQTTQQPKEVIVPPNRPSVGATMPSTPSTPGNSSSNMTVPEFVSYIKENFGFDARQAMSILKVKTLNGINLRAAVARLHAVVEQEAGGGAETRPGSGNNNNATSRPPALGTANAQASGTNKSTPAPASTPPASTPASSPPAPSRAGGPTRATTSESGRPPLELVVREKGPAFDEEVDPEDEDELEDLEDFDDDIPQELSDEERAVAESKLHRLRESRGAATANERRLHVLDNLVNSQISEEQLLELIQGVWSIQTLKKLKVDQVEELISWAKEDDFVSEVEAVLLVLEEERYARGNR
jgi:hypothetical protein